MQIHLSPRHMPLTAALHQAVAAQIGSLEDFGIDIIGAHVVLEHTDASAMKDRYQVRVHLAVPGPDIFANFASHDLYLALEQVTAKLARQLRKRKTAWTDKPRKTKQRAVERQHITGETPRSLKKGLANAGIVEVPRIGSTDREGVARVTRKRRTVRAKA
ncbi:ribosome hibernation-promoting factor, HPF/YfiA family [Verrucomicrobiota bacterium sgz303538]